MRDGLAVSPGASASDRHGGAASVSVYRPHYIVTASLVRFATGESEDISARLDTDEIDGSTRRSSIVRRTTFDFDIPFATRTPSLDLRSRQDCEKYGHQ